MPESEGSTREGPTRRRCTAMHSTHSRHGGLIRPTNDTNTSKCPYMCVCYSPRRPAIRDGMGTYGGSERCKMHDAPLSGVVG